MKRLNPTQRRKGAAIVTVLAVVVLATVLVVSLFQRAVTEKQMSFGSTRRQSAELHANTVMQWVVAQLRIATGGDPASPLPGPWSSQPGGVTVYRQDGTIGTIHKLYSAREVTTTDPATLDADLPHDWDRVPGQFVDLNQPTVHPSGSVQYPIADPRQAGANGVEGYSILPGGAPRGTGAGGGNVDPGEVPRLPMPVRWIYLLRDGTPGVLDDQGKFRSSRGEATVANPIVARVAWWADDETARINVNTAGEASPWDTPRLTTMQDRALALFQPMRGEYHRYPGHPAGVSLSSILFPHSRWLQPHDLIPQGETPLSAADAAALWDLLAGASTDSALTSAGGTRRPPGLELPGGNGVQDSWHLYGSAAELIFGQDRRTRPLFEKNPGLVRRLAQGDFLLTATSRAPETTLRGTPRVSLWPIHESVVPGIGFSSPVERASATDSLLALCTTAGSRRYYVQRAVPGDGSADFLRTGLGANARLFDWLCGFMGKPVPGFDRPVGPRTFEDKYGAGAGGDAWNLIALMMDYIRTTNLADGAIPRQNQFSIVCPGNETEGYGQISPLDTTPGSTPSARWKPAQLESARGLGRFPGIQGAVLIVTCRAWCDEAGNLHGTPSSTAARTQLRRPGARELEAALLFEGFIPGQGWAESRPYCSLVVAGNGPGAPTDFSRPLPAMTLNGCPLLPAAAADLEKWKATLTKRNSLPAGSTASGGSAAVLLGNTLLFSPFVVTPAHPQEEYLQFNGTFGGAPGEHGLKVGVFDSPGITARTASSAQGDLVQVVELHFPPIPGGAVPLPSLLTGREPSLPLSERLISHFETGGPLLLSSDVAQSLVLAHGDSRQVTGRKWVTADFYATHPAYGRKSLAHRLAGEPGSSRALPGAGYFADLIQPPDTQPDFPVQPWEHHRGVALAGSFEHNLSVIPMSAAFHSTRRDGGKRGIAEPGWTGDFDTASGRTVDGPYINRADDGELRGFLEGGTPYFDAPPSDPKTVPSVSAAASSPNRLVPGPGMFGSLPTGIKARVPWQTLLFRPWAGAPSSPPHHGATWPPDHLLMDLFWMPVVEPYGISTPLETAGKINLNQEILPFRHIRRETALHALLKSERIVAIADSDASAVKQTTGFSAATGRLPIDAAATLDQWRKQREVMGRPWISASEICTLPLVPWQEPRLRGDPGSMAAWWARHRLTGDNLKERPYTNLHARLTTRSNTFRLYVLAQSLQKSKTTAADQWDESGDSVAAVWRGQCLISRQVDAGALPDYVAQPGSPPVDRYYTWSITRMQQ